MQDAFRIDIIYKVVCHSGIVLSTSHNIWNNILYLWNIHKKSLKIRSRKSKDIQYSGQMKKGKTMIYQKLHSKLKIDQHEPHKYP
jgi:hypothetical protein